jgi:hypothetical protein
MSNDQQAPASEQQNRCFRFGLFSARRVAASQRLARVGVARLSMGAFA